MNRTQEMKKPTRFLTAGNVCSNNFLAKVYRACSFSAGTPWIQFVIFCCLQLPVVILHAQNGGLTPGPLLFGNPTHSNHIHRDPVPDLDRNGNYPEQVKAIMNWRMNLQNLGDEEDLCRNSKDPKVKAKYEKYKAADEAFGRAYVPCRDEPNVSYNDLKEFWKRALDLRSAIEYMDIEAESKQDMHDMDSISDQYKYIPNESRYDAAKRRIEIQQKEQQQNIENSLKSLSNMAMWASGDDKVWNHYRGPSLYFHAKVALQMEGLPAVANTNTSTSTTDAYGNQYGPSVKNTSAVKTVFLIGTAIHTSFAPINSPTLAFSVLGNFKVMGAPAGLAVSVAGVDITEESQSLFFSVATGARLEYGFKGIRAIGEYQYEYRSLSSVSTETIDAYYYDGSSKSIVTIDAVNAHAGVHKIGLGLSYTHYDDSQKAHKVEVIDYLEKPDFDLTGSTSIRSYHNLIYISYYYDNIFGFNFFIAPNYPAFGTAENNTVNTQSTGKYYMGGGLFFPLTVYGQSFFNKDDYDGWKSGELSANIMTNGIIGSAGSTSVLSPGAGGQVRFKIGNQGIDGNKFEFDMKVNGNLNTYQNEFKAEETMVTLNASPTFKYWRKIVKKFNIGVSAEYLMSYIGNSSSANETTHGWGYKNVFHFLGGGPALGLPTSELVNIQVREAFLYDPIHAKLAYNTDLEFAYKLFYMMFNYTYMPDYNAINNQPRQFTHVVQAGIGARLPW